MSLTKKIGLLICAGMMMSSVAVVQAGGTKSNWSGNIGVYSQYILRGITNAPEDSSVALQGSIDWSQGDNGFYAGVWGSSLGYSESSLPLTSKPAASRRTSDGFEFDAYAGYKGKIGSLSWSLGFIQYLYANLDDFNGLEATGSIGFGPFTFGFQTLTNDIFWGNAGDTYWTLSYGTKLPRKWELNVKLGYYTYEETGKFDTTLGDKDGFRHLDVTLSHPIGNTGAKVHFTGILGGEDRNGVDQDNAFVVGISYDFDL